MGALNKIPLLMQNKEIIDRYNVFEKCIFKQFKIKSEYLSLKNETTNSVSIIIDCLCITMLAKERVKIKPQNCRRMARRF